MFRKLFSRDAATGPRAPDDCVIYAVGDIHGRADALGPLLEAIVQDAQQSPAKRIVIIALGDYVDRGADSRRVIDLLLAVSRVPLLETHFLRGNHDETLLGFLSDPASGPTWCDYGGRETLASYGVIPPSARTDAEAWARTAEAFADALPSSHKSFFVALKDSVEIGDYFFCHAGARPGVPLHQQSQRDLLWIREPFLQDDRRFEKVVVHGHTPDEAVHSDRRRIGVDTGAYATGLLTAARLEGATRRFIQASVRPGGSARVAALDEMQARRAGGGRA